MRKFFFAIAMMAALTLTSCSDDVLYVQYSDCSRIEVEHDDDGHIIGRTLVLVDGQEFPLTDGGFNLLSKTRNIAPSQLIVIEYAGAGEYHASISASRTEVINLHE